MTTTSPESPGIDFSRMSFPTDKLTVKAIRDADTRLDYFDIGPHPFGNIEAIVITERDIARNAFNAALSGLKPARIGKRDHESAWERREMLDGLDFDYQRYGISSGPKQSVELVRDIEAQAVAQAKEHVGPGR